MEIRVLHKDYKENLVGIIKAINKVTPISMQTEDILNRCESHLSYVTLPFLSINYFSKDHFNFIDTHFPLVRKFINDHPDVVVYCELNISLSLIKYSPKSVIGCIEDFYDQNEGNLFHLIVASIIEKILTNKIVKLDIDKLPQYRFRCSDRLLKFRVKIDSLYSAIRSLEGSQIFHYDYYDPEELIEDPMFQYHQWVIYCFLGEE